MYKEGNKLFNAEEYQKAAQKFQELTKGQFFKKEAWLHTGYCYLSLVRAALDDEEANKYTEQAVQAFTTYLTLVPEDKKIEDYIFNVYMDSRNYEKVLQFLFNKFEQDPNDIRAIQLIIQTYEDTGKIYEAIEWYKKRCEVTPDDSNAYYSFAVFYWRNSYYNQRLETSLRATFVDEGIDLVQQAIELSPEFADGYIYWNLLLREKAKYTKSKSATEKLLEQAKELQKKGSELRKAQQEKEALEKGEPLPTSEDEGDSTDTKEQEETPEEPA
ncbi:tetratricopeptide repeat protein [candidate division CSSED10-310 bacterium]|uniref:Tetratricopeptide repeat protein n=1 Tax=candidate division CSSED10-310 bacterium TaxID=2855610 RepID=A0ABV6YUN3_UNCC1